MFADTLYFKDGRELEGNIIFIGKGYIVFKVAKVQFDIADIAIYPEGSIFEIIDDQTIVFNEDHVSISKDQNGLQSPTSKVKLVKKKEPKPSLDDKTFSVFIGFNSPRGIGLIGFSKNLKITENIGIYFSAGQGTVISRTDMAYGIGIYNQGHSVNIPGLGKNIRNHYNDNGWNIAAVFGMAEIGGTFLNTLINYQWRIGDIGLLSVGIFRGDFHTKNPRYHMTCCPYYSPITVSYTHLTLPTTPYV